MDVCDLALQQAHHHAIKAGKIPVFQKITLPDTGQQETYDSYCNTHRIHTVGKPRFVMNHRQADLSDTATFVLSNTLHGQAPGITRIRRHRWPVEVSHEEGNADGLDL